MSRARHPHRAPPLHHPGTPYSRFRNNPCRTRVDLFARRASSTRNPPLSTRRKSPDTRVIRGIDGSAITADRDIRRFRTRAGFGQPGRNRDSRSGDSYRVEIGEIPHRGISTRIELIVSAVSRQPRAFLFPRDKLSVTFRDRYIFPRVDAAWMPQLNAGWNFIRRTFRARQLAALTATAPST